VKNVHHVIWSIGDATTIGVLLAHTTTSQLFPRNSAHTVKTDLSRENEFGKFFRVDPTELVEDRQCREYPEAIANLTTIWGSFISRRETVANIFLLLRSSIEASVGKLPLCQPPTKRLVVYFIKTV
jgi:hypothetical protein